MKKMFWTLVGLGTWLVLSPWILGFSGLNLALWNNVLLGGFVILSAFWGFSPFEE